MSTARAIYNQPDRITGDPDQNIDALLSGWRWDADGHLTFSFPDHASDLGYSLPWGESFASELNTSQKAVAYEALALISHYTPLKFQEIGDDFQEDDADALLRFYEINGIDTAYAYFPGNFSEEAGDMAFNAQSFDDPRLGTYEYSTFLHELGHALGLRHGHETNGPGPMTPDRDSTEYSIMTYRSFPGQDLEKLPFSVKAHGSDAQTFMIYDIAALQRMYGANFEANSDDSVYTFNRNTGEMYINGVGMGAPDRNKIFRAIWDGEGDDTYDLSNFDTDLLIRLRPGTYSDFDVGGNSQRAELNYGIESNNFGGYFYGSQYEVFSRGHVFNALTHEGDSRSLIENALGGTGMDRIVGNSAANTLQGNDGKDTLAGGGGRDKLIGNAGNDYLNGGNSGDLLLGGNNRDKLYGGNGQDKLNGGRGADLLNGGAHDDELIGGAGSDTFVFKTGGGHDTILDFESRDILDIRDHQYSSYQDACSGMMQSGDDLIFVFESGDQVTLLGVEISEIHSGNLLWV